MGGMLGGAFGYIDRTLFVAHTHTELGAFALVGMGAMFAAVIRSPITSVLIIFEMTGSYELVLPLMIANSAGYVLSRRFYATPIYEAVASVWFRESAAQVSAADCDRYGIANRVVPAADLAATVDELAGRLATGPSKAIQMTKWLVNRSLPRFA